MTLPTTQECSGQYVHVMFWICDLEIMVNHSFLMAWCSISLNTLWESVMTVDTDPVRHCILKLQWLQRNVFSYYTWTEHNRLFYGSSWKRMDVVLASSGPQTTKASPSLQQHHLFYLRNVQPCLVSATMCQSSLKLANKNTFFVYGKKNPRTRWKRIKI